MRTPRPQENHPASLTWNFLLSETGTAVTSFTEWSRDPKEKTYAKQRVNSCSTSRIVMKRWVVTTAWTLFPSLPARKLLYIMTQHIKRPVIIYQYIKLNKYCQTNDPYTNDPPTFFPSLLFSFYFILKNIFILGPSVVD